MRAFLLATTIALAVPVAAHADFIFSPTGGSTGDTIQFESHFTNQTSFFGDTNHGANSVQFLTLGSNGTPTTTQLIGTNGEGQADVICTSNCNTFSQGGANGAQLTGLEIKPGIGFAFTEFIGNLDFGEGTTFIRVSDQLGATFTYTLGNGSNFFKINAINNEVITDIKIFEDTTSGGEFGWNDLKQPRVTLCTEVSSTSCTPLVNAPEPSTIAVLGAGLLGLIFLKKRRA